MEREEREKKELKESGVVVSQGGTGTGSGGGSKGGSKLKKQKKEAEHGGAGGGVVRGVFGSNKSRNKGDRRQISSRSFGPAPDVGFMSKGMLKVKNPGR